MDDRAKLNWLSRVCRAPGRTLGAIRLAAALASHDGPARAEWPSQRSLAETAGIGRRNLRRALEELEAGDFVVVTDPGSPRRTARYRLVTPS